MRSVITRFPHLENLDHIYINLKTKNIEMLIANDYIFPVRFSLVRLDFEKLLLGTVLKVEDSLLDEIMVTLSEKYI